MITLVSHKVLFKAIALYKLIGPRALASNKNDKRDDM